MSGGTYLNRFQKNGGKKMERIKELSVEDNDKRTNDLILSEDELSWENVNKFINRCLFLFTSQDRSDMLRNSFKKILSFYSHKAEQHTKDDLFILGGYIGATIVYSDLLAKKEEYDIAVTKMKSYEVDEIPHINDIISIVKKNPGIRHGVLAEMIGIDRSTLTGLMNRLVKESIIEFTRPGKYKYYYLTDLGKEYYKRNQLAIDSIGNLNSLIEQLRIYLSREKDPNAKILSVISALCSDQGRYSGSQKSTKEIVDPSIIFAGMPSLKELNVAFRDSEPHLVNDGIVMNVLGEKTVVLSDGEDAISLSTDLFPKKSLIF